MIEFIKDVLVGALVIGTILLVICLFGLVILWVTNTQWSSWRETMGVGLTVPLLIFCWWFVGYVVRDVLEGLGFW